MDIQILENGLQKQLPGLEDFLKTILMKKVSVEMPASSEAQAEMITEALKTGTVVIQGYDKKFGVDVFLAYDDNWIPQLSMAMLGIEETDVNEVTRDLMKEFSQQMFGNVQMSLKDEGLEVDPSEVSILKTGQIGPAIDKENYFIAQISVSGKFEIEGDEQPDMAMILAFEVPSDEKIEQVMAPKESPKPAAAKPKKKEPEPEPEPKPQMDTTSTDEDDMDLSDFMDDPSGTQLSDEEIESLLADAEDSMSAPTPAPSRKARPSGPAVAGKKVEFDNFNPDLDFSSSTEVRNLNILKDVELGISVELGRKDLPLGEVLHLVRGSVIELEKLAGEPVEVYANGHRIAEGEVVVIDEHFGVRITNLVSTRERLESLR